MKALLLCAALLATASSIALAEPRAPKSAAPAQTPTDGGAGTAASVPAFVIEYQKLPSKETRENGKQAREGDKRFVLKLTPAARQWLAAETARTQSAQPFTAEQALADVRANYAALGALSDADIMAIAFIVMMEATKSAREDLKSIMDGVKLINKQKEGLRKV